MISADAIFLCLPICCGVTALCCCIGGNRIPGTYFHHRHFVHPIVTPPESQIIHDSKEIVLIQNPGQSEVFLGIVEKK